MLINNMTDFNDLHTDIITYLLKWIDYSTIPKFILINKSTYTKIIKRPEYLCLIDTIRRSYHYKNCNKNLYKAVQNNDLTAVKKFVNEGACFKFTQYYHKAIENDNFKMVSYWLKKNNVLVGHMDLCLAVEANAWGVFKFLCNKLFSRDMWAVTKITEIWLNPQSPFKTLNNINEITNGFYELAEPPNNIIDRLLLKQMETRYFEIINWEFQSVSSTSLDIAISKCSLFVVCDIASKLCLTPEQFLLILVRHDKYDYIEWLEQYNEYKNLTSDIIIKIIETAVFYNASCIFMKYATDINILNITNKDDIIENGFKREAFWKQAARSSNERIFTVIEKHYQSIGKPIDLNKAAEFCIIDNNISLLYYLLPKVNYNVCNKFISRQVNKKYIRNIINNK